MKNKRILITEDDRYRILSMHNKVRAIEFGLILKEADEQVRYIKYPEGNVSQMVGDGALPTGAVEITKEEFDKLGGYMPSNSPTTPPTTGSTTPPTTSAVATGSTSPSTPTTNFDITKKENIQKFQDYMNTVGPWVRQPNGSFTTLKTNSTGYGKFGPSTKAAWAKYKDSFLTRKIGIAPELKPLQINKLSPSSGTTNVNQMTTAKVATAQAAGTPTTTTQATGTTTTQATEIKTAEQIKKEYRQGKKNLKDLKNERDKLYNTYNRLSDKMSRQDQNIYLNKIAELDNLIKNPQQA